jgi:hypothetical protein
VKIHSRQGSRRGRVARERESSANPPGSGPLPLPHRFPLVFAASRRSRGGEEAAANNDAELPFHATEAVARRDAIRDAWEAEGSPLLATGSTGQLTEHAYMRMLREHDLLVDRLGAVVRKRHRGPNPSAVVTPSPAAKLRAVR